MTVYGIEYINMENLSYFNGNIFCNLLDAHKYLITRGFQKDDEFHFSKNRIEGAQIIKFKLVEEMIWNEPKEKIQN